MGFPDGSAVKNPPAMQEAWVRPLGLKDHLEKEMAIYSSILAWEIPWTEKPGGLQSMGSEKSQTWVSNPARPILNNEVFLFACHSFETFLRPISPVPIFFLDFCCHWVLQDQYIHPVHIEGSIYNILIHSFKHNSLQGQAEDSMISPFCVACFYITVSPMLWRVLHQAHKTDEKFRITTGHPLKQTDGQSGSIMKETLVHYFQKTGVAFWQGTENTALQTEHCNTGCWAQNRNFRKLHHF